VSDRRQPTQERSRQLVESILIGTQQLLRTTPPQDITAAMLAEAADCSPAALYRFFSDKEAIFAAVAERLQEALRDRYNQAFSTLAADATVEATVQLLLEVTATFLRKEPAFRALRWSNAARAVDIEHAYKESNRFLANLLAQRFGGPKRTWVSAVEAAGHMVGVAFEHNPKGDARILKDALRMTVLFLQDALHVL
jgi:AcrR family transcriptional regulator